MPDVGVIRPTAVAGLFYAEDRQQLTSAVEAYLAEGRRRGRDDLQSGAIPEGKVKALICPHAGYAFSGPIAGSAYATLSSRSTPVERVVLIGPAHRVAVRGLVAAAAGFFATPLGAARIDPVVGQLCSEGLISINDAAHRQEHALEVQLPFLQSVLPEPYTIVPLLFGRCESAEVAAVIDRLWGGDETLFIISSDLSHFHPQARAIALDQQTSAAIEALDGSALEEGSACGRLAIQGLLAVAQSRGLRAKAIDVRTSADTAGDPERVVGYGAYVLYE